MSDDRLANPDAFLDSLAADLRPTPRSALRRRLLAGLGIGMVIAAVLMIPWLGLRADLAGAVSGPIFWVKFGYTLVSAVAGYIAVNRLARPGGHDRRAVAIAALALLIAGAAGLVQWFGAPPEAQRALVLGGSALVCPLYIVALSLPVFTATILVMRRLAPTRLTQAGAAAGLLAGSAGALVYSLHCGENGLPFLALWYTTGIALVTALGALTGRWLLRW
ncbi:MAG: hypothetical protein JWR75_1402 [Devosia sp.]|nr:hypothetical protein [Devosia sp.]